MNGSLNLSRLFSGRELSTSPESDHEGETDRGDAREEDRDIDHGEHDHEIQEIIGRDQSARLSRSHR